VSEQQPTQTPRNRRHNSRRPTAPPPRNGARANGAIGTAIPVERDTATLDATATDVVVATEAEAETEPSVAERPSTANAVAVPVSVTETTVTETTVPALPDANDDDADDADEFDEIEEAALRDEAAEVAETTGREVSPSLDRRIALPALGAEAVCWFLTLAVALLTRLAALTNIPLSTPEAQRAYAAWQWSGGFVPVVDGRLWGPFAFLQTGLFFFLFGARDSVGRIGPALAGVALVAACWWLRPYIGRWGAVGVAVLIALSPSFAFGSRQLTGLPWAALAAFILYLWLVRATESRPTRGGLFLALGALVVALTSGPGGLTLLLTLALALALTIAFAPRTEERPVTTDTTAATVDGDSDDDAEPDTVAQVEPTPALSFTTAAAATAPARLGAHLGAMDRRTRSAGFVFLAASLLAVFGLLFTDLAGLPATLASVFGEWGGTLFTATRNEPPFYYPMIAFNYEMLIGVATIVGLVLLWRMRSPRPFALSLAAVWQLMALVVFSLSGDKSPEAMVLLLLPAAITGGVAFEWAVTQLSDDWFWRGRGWLVGVGAVVTTVAAVQFLREVRAADRSPVWVATIFALIIFLCVAGYVTASLAARQRPADARNTVVATLLLLSGILGVRAMSNVVFTNAGDPRELLVGSRSAPGITPLVERIERVSTDLTRNPQFRTFDPQRGDRANIAGGRTTSIVADSSAQWPLQWYFRDYPNFGIGDANTAAQARPVGTDGQPLPQIVVTQAAVAGAAPPQIAGYTPQNYAYTVNFPAGYRGESIGSLLGKLTNGASWVERLSYWLSRTTAQPPTTTDLTIFYSPEVANRIFYNAGGGAAGGAASAQSFGLFDKGGRGKGEGQFVSPRGIGVGSDGTITVVDALNYRVEQFRPDGGFLRQFGGPGTTPDKFGQLRGFAFGPTGLATAPDGTIYVADTWNHRVSAFTADGKPVRQWGTFFNGQDDPTGLTMHPGDFYGPRGIAVGPDGNVYVADGGNGRVSVFRPDGTYVRTVGSRGSGPGQLLDIHGVAVKADGTLAVADPDNGRIQLFTASGMYLSSIPVMDWTTIRGLEPYLAWLPNGNLLVPSPTTNRLYEITQAGMTVRTITGAVGDLRRPVAVALAPDGTTVYVTNDETHTVSRIGLAG